MFFREYHIYFTRTTEYLDISDSCYSTRKKYQVFCRTREINMVFTKKNILSVYVYVYKHIYSFISF